MCTVQIQIDNMQKKARIQSKSILQFFLLQLTFNDSALPKSVRALCHFDKRQYKYTDLNVIILRSGLHKLWYPGIRDMSTWSKFGAHGERGDVFLFSNLGAL